MRKIKLFLYLFIITCILCIGKMQAEAYNQDTLIIMPDGSTPANGCTLVGVEGDFISDAEQALKRINQIRLEACTEGIRNPQNPTKQLTKNDYVPIQWSYDLQEIAMFRAAEASRVTGTTRPSGANCFTAKSSNGVKSSAESLVWNSSSSLLTAIEKWYTHKPEWVNSGTTNAYTVMINPAITFVGMSSFISVHGVYYNSTVAEFSKASKMNTEIIPSINNAIVVINMKSDALSGDYVLLKNRENLQDSNHLDVGDTLQYSLGIAVNVDNEKSYVTDINNSSWTSSNENIATVDACGTVTITGSGKVTISATNNLGKTASVTLLSGHSWESKVVKATQNSDGVIFKRCVSCKKDTDIQVIKKIESVKLKATFYQYTGKEIKPAVVVKDSDEKKISSEYYNVTYSNNKKAGIAKATIIFHGKYEGSKQLKFTIKAVEKNTNTITAKNIKKTASSNCSTFKIGASAKDKAKLTYKSDNKSIKVDSEGTIKVSSHYIGKAKITITAAETGIYKKTTKIITVTVLPASKVEFMKKPKKHINEKNLRGIYFELKQSPGNPDCRIQVATSSDFSSDKIVLDKIVEYSSSYFIPANGKITTGKTYYIRFMWSKNGISSGKWTKYGGSITL